MAAQVTSHIPNCTAASASHGGASPPRCPVVENSISVVVEDPLQIDDGAMSTLNAHGTRSTTTAGSSQTSTMGSSRPSPVHPIAAHWTSATLISFFLNLPFHIQSLASSRNNQTPNRTIASASHGGTSPTCCPANSVVVDVPLQIDDGAIRTSNAHGTRSTTTAGSSQARTFDSSRPSLVHPIASLFQSQELGKVVLGFAVPLTTGLLFNQYEGLTHPQASAVLLALSIGFTTTWNGMLLRGMCPRFAIALECFGVGSVLVAFFGLVSSFLPPSLVWACWLCCGLSCLPFLLCLVPPPTVEEESSAERLEQGLV